MLFPSADAVKQTEQKLGSFLLLPIAETKLVLQLETWKWTLFPQLLLFKVLDLFLSNLFCQPFSNSLLLFTLSSSLVFFFFSGPEEDPIFIFIFHMCTNPPPTTTLIVLQLEEWDLWILLEFNCNPRNNSQPFSFGLFSSVCFRSKVGILAACFLFYE